MNQFYAFYINSKSYTHFYYINLIGDFNNSALNLRVYNYNKLYE